MQEFQRLRYALEKWGAEVKQSLPATRGRVRPSENAPSTGIAHRIQALRDEYGLTLDAIRREVGAALKQEIPLSTLYAWVNGSLPRRFAVESVEEVLDEIMTRHPRYEDGVWVKPSEVQATVQEWEKHLSKRQIAVAADESLSVIESWAAGRHHVMRPKWDRVVESIQEVLVLLGKHKG